MNPHPISLLPEPAEVGPMPNEVTESGLPALDTVQAALYPNGIGVRNRYEFVSGVCLLPVAEDPPTSAAELRDWSPVVKLVLHAPYRVRRMHYDVPRKQNNPPVLPTPKDTGSFVFTGGSISLHTEFNQTGYCYDWIGAASYTYVEKCVSRPEDGLVLGTPAISTYMTETNRQIYSNNPPPNLYGAVAHAGLDAVLGVGQGAAINLNGAWSYNTASYFPPQLFDDTLANGGAPVVPVTS